VVHELYPSKEALDAASGSTGAMPEVTCPAIFGPRET